MAQTISSSKEHDFCSLKLSEIENLALFLLPILTKVGIKEPEARELIKSQAAMWKCIEEECSLNQIEYGVKRAYQNYKKNPLKCPLTMRNFMNQISVGNNLSEKFYEK